MPIIDGITPLIHTQMMGVCREPRLYAFDFQIQATANQTGTIYYTQSIHDSTIEWGDGSVTKIHDASVTA